MNRDKTILFHAGLNLQESGNLSDLGFQHGLMPVRYLGLPLMHRKLRRADYSPLIDKIKARLHHWTVKCLSFAGRLQLITSVVYSLVNFWLSAFALPKGCLKEIQSLCARFLWAGDIDKKAAAKVAWTNLCLPKSEGGLGLRDFVRWNKVLNLKLLWLIISGSGSLWVAWNKEHMLRGKSIWVVDAHNTSSWIWKFILSLRPLAKGLVSCKIGDGNQASFLFDHWTPHGPLIEFVGSSGPRLIGVPIEAKVSQAVITSGWRLPSPRSRSESLLALRQTLCTTPAPQLSRGPDSFRWGPPNATSTRFSTKIAWDQLRSPAPKVTWAKIVWFKGSIPKQAFHFWIANMDRLPVRARLVSWGMNISHLCCLCNLETETRDHLFLHCEVADQLWNLVLGRLGLPTFIFHNWSALVAWLSSRSSGTSPKLKLMAAQGTVYYLWRERNNRLFKSTSIPASVICSNLP
ncbi:putative ribonuclease H protein [Cardamine amara subsp. amara]|uniref:Ribonuclease H protein n=1 Tax=Cardamine amara subsp. amara TaxID=228776 RepID=A0ABD0ZAP3_CARAN